MSIGIRVQGVNRAVRDLQRLGVSVEDLKGAFHPITNKVVNDAKRLTPVRTGLLRSTMRGSNAKNKSLIRGGRARVNYASFVEFGSVNNKAQHMVEKAITSNETYALQTLERELDSLIRKYGLN